MLGRRVCSRCGDVYQEIRFGRPAAVCGSCVDQVAGRLSANLGESSGTPWGAIAVFGLLVGAVWLARER